MRRVFFASVSLLLLLAATLPGPANAANYTLTIYGNASYSPSSTAKTFIQTANLSDLSTITYGDGTVDCPRGYWQLNNPRSWVNCISSFKIQGASCHDGVNFYYSPGYVNLARVEWGAVNVSYVGDYQNDAYQSIKFTYRITCPSSATP